MKADLSGAIPALGSLTAAEICVVEAAQRGECAEFSPPDWRIQDALTRLKEHASTVRPSVIRYLLLGGDQTIKVHEHGVSIKNAYIAGDIDLEGCNVELKLTLSNCYVEGILNLTDARTRTIDLGGSRVAKIRGQRIRIDGSLLLQDRFLCEGRVRLSGEITRNLQLAGGTFKWLSRGESQEADVARYGKSAAPVLHLENLRVLGTFFLGPLEPPLDQHVKVIGSIDLQDAYARIFVDREGSWPPEEAWSEEHGKLRCELLLDGFTYDAVWYPNDVTSRKKWLQRQPVKHLIADFRPQPFEQLTKVLRSMGYEKEAAEIRRLKQRYMIPSRVKQSYFLDKLFVWVGWHLFGIFAGFGFRPRRLFFTLMVLWVACSATFYVAAQQGVFMPSERAAFEDAKYEGCRPPRGNWIACDYPGHPPFSAPIYAADNLQPLINFGQKTKWIPSKRSFTYVLGGIEWSFPAWAIPVIAWFEILLGTILWVTFVATATGLILPK